MNYCRVADDAIHHPILDPEADLRIICDDCGRPVDGQGNEVIEDPVRTFALELARELGHSTLSLSEPGPNTMQMTVRILNQLRRHGFELSEIF